MAGESHFFAIVSRMRYIERWALMRSARPENLSEHALDVAMIAHALCTIGNVRHGRALNADRAAVIGLFHDASEIVTGDMPTPVKYKNAAIRDAYKDVEREATDALLATLPDDLRPTYAGVLGTSVVGAAAAADVTAASDGTVAADDVYLRTLVRAADKLAAYIKCVEEAASGNVEFSSAAATTYELLCGMRAACPEVADFMDEFLPSYGRTLDELLGGNDGS